MSLYRTVKKTKTKAGSDIKTYHDGEGWREIECRKIEMFVEEAPLLHQYCKRHIRNTSLFYIKRGIKIMKIDEKEKNCLIFLENISTKEALQLAELTNKMNIDKIHLFRTRKIEGFVVFLLATQTLLTLSIKKKINFWLPKSFRMKSVVHLMLEKKTIEERIKSKLLASIKYLSCLQIVVRKIDHTRYEQFYPIINKKSGMKSNLFVLLGDEHSSVSVQVREVFDLPVWDDNFLKYIMKEFFVNQVNFISPGLLNFVYDGETNFIQRIFNNCYSF